MTLLGEYNYAPFDGQPSDALGPTARLFVTTTPKPSAFNLTYKQQYNLQMPNLLKIFKKFDYFGSVEFTTVNGYLHVHVILNIHNKEDKMKWLKALPLLKKIGNTKVKLIGDTEKDLQTVEEYLIKDVDVTASLIPNMAVLLPPPKKETINLSKVDISALDNGLRILKHKITKNDSTESPS